MPSTLSIDTLIQVMVNLSPAAAQAQSTSVELVLGNSAVIDTLTRIRYYTTLSGVAADFGTSAPEYLAAQLWFAQSPQPTSIAIGRWAQTATNGALFCGVLEPAQLALSYWTAITAGSFHVSIDGTGHDVTGLNFSGATSLNGVAAIIQAALVSGFGGTPTCVYNANFTRFEIYSGTTGTASIVTFLTAAATGTDISGPMEGLSSDASSGAYTVAGIAAETAVSAATLFDLNFGMTWYALVMPTINSDPDHVAVASFIEAATNKHVYGITTNEGAIINNPADTTNVAYLIKQLKPNRTYVQYSSTSAYAISSAFARILTTNYAANNTVITLMYKQEPLIAAENLNPTQLSTLQGFNCNVFAAYNNNTAILESFVSGSGLYADVLMGSDNFALQLQTDLYNLLYLSPTKIPQTDAGTHQITSVIKQDCIQYVNNGFIAPGVWNVAGFGQLKQGDFLATGFYIFAPSVSTQAQTQRQARISVPIQVAIKLAGAVQTVNLQVTVNQ